MGITIHAQPSWEEQVRQGAGPGGRGGLSGCVSGLLSVLRQMRKAGGSLKLLPESSCSQMWASVFRSPGFWFLRCRGEGAPVRGSCRAGTAGPIPPPSFPQSGPGLEVSFSFCSPFWESRLGGSSQPAPLTSLSELPTKALRGLQRAPAPPGQPDTAGPGSPQPPRRQLLALTTLPTQECL